MANRVARYHADRTNQKLYFVRIYCQLAEQSDNNQLKQCHIESAILHLYGGYLAFLQEVARYYGLAMPEPSLENIEVALAKKTQISPEIVRLSQLKHNDFLAEIEQAWQQVQYKPTPNNSEPIATNNDVGKNSIPIFDVMANESANQVNTRLEGVGISADMVRQWREQLSEVIDSLREGMIAF